MPTKFLVLGGGGVGGFLKGGRSGSAPTNVDGPKGPFRTKNAIPQESFEVIF